MSDSSGQTMMRHRDLMAWIHTYQEAYFMAYIFIFLAWVSKMWTSLHKESN
jgi:hypothetical protein